MLNIEYFVQTFCISILTLKTSYKLVNFFEEDSKINFKEILAVILINIVNMLLNTISSSIISLIVLVASISIIFSKKFNKKIGYSGIIVVISFSINYITYMLSATLCYVLVKIFNISNRAEILIGIISIYIIIIYLVSNMKKIRKGITFLKSNESLVLLTLNISSILVLALIIFGNVDLIAKRSLFIYIIIFSILMFITIQKSLQLYYKQKILIQDLNETKAELESKKKEIEELEKENLEYSKTSHSIAHKQKLLEYKLKELLLKNEFAEDMDIKDEINNLTKEIRTKTLEIELAKTNINKIDDILKYMQSECIKEKIDFQLQLNGNIHYMINNCISEEELQILLADHIKNAIIAIKHTDNINKSILVRLGLIEGIYSVYIYDSGIEFNTETLVKLGKEPASTHLDEGGTGMGFMNTFDTLRKYKASIVVCEYGKPSEERFTKLIKIIFDKKNEYKISSYRNEEIREKDFEKRIELSEESTY